MEQLYRKLTDRAGQKAYAPTVHGKVIRLFKTASQAQTHSERVRARLERLRAAANL